jgi:hypothetical protein
VKVRSDAGFVYLKFPVQNRAMRVTTLVALLSFLVAASASGSAHPGNIFLAGEDVAIAVPESWKGWQAVDIEGKQVARGAGADRNAALGKLPVGYCELREADGEGKVTAGVIAASEPVAETPIALDAAVSWFYSDPEQIRGACRLARLAGVRWVRDRSSWPELEPARGTWSPEGRYEKAMRIEHECGLKVLQVNHISPPWAGSNATKFPEDLRDVYAFYRGLAGRWKGLTDAIEPWNEPDIDVFGGHTGCEIASFQKAAYLGLKAGNPELAVNDTVFAIDRAETLDEFGGNEVSPYFDRYDLHHYIRLPDYPRAYGRHRAVSGGRPMWTTEFNLTVHWADEKTKEPSEEELRVQSFRVGKVFAEALHEGTEKAFYFILGHYVERNLQYGLIHNDLTPRPAYVAFAAVGRLLNGAQPLGRVDLGEEKLKGYLFKTTVDGDGRETLVAWSETKATTVAVPAGGQVYDYLGREVRQGGTVSLSRETMFMILPPGGSKGLKIQAPPVKPAFQQGNASAVVLQFLGRTDFKQSAFVLDKSKPIRLVAYNFGEAVARGRVSVEGATGDPGEIEIAPGARVERTITAGGPGRVTARLDLGSAGHAIVSAHVVSEAATTSPTR